MSERGVITCEIGDELLRLTDTMFEWWHRVRDGTMKRSTFRTYMGPVRRRVEALLERGASCSLVRGKFKDILVHRRALWTFMRVEGVEPTNNHAEQQVRHGVVLRKISLGTQSARGSRFVERMLTMVATLRKQGRKVHGFLSEACHARVLGTPAPSLLPNHATDQAS